MNDFNYRPPSFEQEPRDGDRQESGASSQTPRNPYIPLPPPVYPQDRYRSSGTGYASSIKRRADGYAIASFVLGLLSTLFTTCFCCLFYLAIVVGITSLIFSFLSKKRQGAFHPLALTGMILAFVGLFFATLIIAVFASGLVGEEDFNAMLLALIL